MCQSAYLWPGAINKLRVPSIVKVDRIVTLKKEDVIATLGTLTETEPKQFKAKFKQVID